MATSFGEQLRLAREARGISLREISEQTRISTRYLEAIERGDLKRLPGGIFNRSFIKAYAKYIGYDEKEALDAYTHTAREMGTSPEDISITPYKPNVYTDGLSSRSPFVTLLLTIVILSILSLGIYAALHWYQRREAASTGSTPAKNAPAAAIPTAAPNTGNGAPAAAAALTIEITAGDQDVWMRTRVDEEESQDSTLSKDESRQFLANQQLSVQFAKSKAGAFDVKINGQPADVPVDATKSLAEIIITKEGYEQFIRKN